MIFHSLTFARSREVLKTESEARDFQPSRGTLRMLMNDIFLREYAMQDSGRGQVLII